MKHIATAMAAQVRAAAVAQHIAAAAPEEGLISIREAVQAQMGVIEEAKPQPDPERRRPYCPHCGSTDVGCEGYLVWDDTANDWAVSHAHDEEDCWCRDCDKSEFVADWLTLAERAEMTYPGDEEGPEEDTQP